MKKVKLESVLSPVCGTYDEDAAELKLWVPGTDYKGTFDELEVDRMLACIAHAMDPDEDLAELFADEFGPWAWRVALLIVTNEHTLGTLVYA